MRAVIVGGSGQIGSWLLQVLKDRGHESVGTYSTVPFEGLEHLVAGDPHAPNWVRDRSPDVVFYPAGFTWVDGCEKDPQKARAANRDEPLAIARAAAEVGARFVYFSTDYVFDGRSGPYRETDEPHPLSVYGEAKLEAERALASELGDAALTIRTSWVYGPERQGKNFAYQLVRTLAAGKPLVCPSDQISSPSYGPDVARAAVSLAEGRVSGLIHVVGPEVIDRVMFARRLAEAFGLDPTRITGKPTIELGQGAPRPLSGGLLTPRLDAILPDSMRSLALALSDFRIQIESGPRWKDPLASS